MEGFIVGFMLLIVIFLIALLFVFLGTAKLFWLMACLLLLALLCTLAFFKEV